MIYTAIHYNELQYYELAQAAQCVSGRCDVISRRQTGDRSSCLCTEVMVTAFTFLEVTFTVYLNWKKKGRGFLSGTNFKSSESSLSSLVGVVFNPPFLARGHPDKLKTESMKPIKKGWKNTLNNRLLWW